MKLFCDLLTRRRSNKKKETVKFSSSPIQTIHQSISPFYDQTSSLFDKQNRCTCHYFNLNGNYSAKNIDTNLISNRLKNIESPSDMKYILTVADFCFWYDVRSTLLDMIDRVVAIDEARHFISEKIPSNIIKFCLPQSNKIHQKMKESKTSIAIQTSSDYQQRRNVKIQTNTMTLCPLQKQTISSSKLFFN